MQILRQQDCYRIAGPHRARQWACSYEGIGPTTALICRSQFGSSMAYSRQGFGIGMK